MELVRTSSLTLDYQRLDARGSWKMSNLFSYLSDEATIHAIDLGLWSPDMFGTYGWVVVDMRLRMKRSLGYGTEVTLKTWPGQGTHVRFPRYYELTTDEVVCQAVSTWTMFDLNKRRIVSPQRMGMAVPVASLEELKLDPLETAGFTEKSEMKRTVAYSDLDANGHMNNARYIEWAMDALDPDLLLRREIAALDVRFRQECHAKETLVLTSDMDERGFQVRGSVNDQVRFEVTGQWAKR